MISLDFTWKIVNLHNFAAFHTLYSRIGTESGDESNVTNDWSPQNSRFAKRGRRSKTFGNLCCSVSFLCNRRHGGELFAFEITANQNNARRLLPTAFSFESDQTCFDIIERVWSAGKSKEICFRMPEKTICCCVVKSALIVVKLLSSKERC